MTVSTVGAAALDPVPLDAVALDPVTAPEVTRAHHAWMPHSPCGAGCIASESPAVRAWRVVLRWAAIVLVLAVVPVLLAARCLPASARRTAAREGARSVLRAMGIRLRASGFDASSPRDGVGTLVVANHVSWTDILVIASVLPCRFVARADLVDWPVLGVLARIVRVVPVDRASLRSLPGSIDEVSDALRAGETVVVFPEGTTWCGTAYGRFRPAFFQAAVDVGADVQPLEIVYRDCSDERSTATAFVGDESIGTSMSRILRLSGIRVDVRAGERLVGAGDRRELAAAAERSVRPIENAVTGVPPMTLVRDRQPRSR